MEYIDSHAHLNFTIYNADRKEVIERTKEGGIYVINVGTQKNTSQFATLLAKEHENLWAIVGLHPIYTSESFQDEDEIGKGGTEFTSYVEVFDSDYYRNLAHSSSRVIGIGECGLDYYHSSKETHASQEIAFRAQIKLALELDLPLMLHIRPSPGSMDAYYDALNILKEYSLNSKLRGQTHFFAGNLDIMKSFINLGFYISFTGVITFTEMYEEIIKKVPMNRILSETDAPYVSPHPYRGKRNEPLYVKEIVHKIALIKKVSIKEMTECIMKNARCLYRL